MKKIFIIGLMSLFLVPLSSAQQEVNYTMFMFNKLTINPAYAGSIGALRVSGHYRNQWTAFDGAPKNFTVSAHSNIFSKRMGGGLTLSSDQAGIVKEYVADLAYSYKIPLKNKSTLSVGLSGMFQYKRINWDKTNALHVDDPELPAVATSRINPNFGVGVYYQAKSYYAGLSVPRLFRTTFYNYTQYEDFGLSASRTAYLMGGLVQKITRNIKFQPGVLLTLNSKTPFEMDLNASLIFLDRFWVGVSYRLEDSVNAIFQIQISEQVKGAVAIDFTLSELHSYAPASFEIMAQYTMAKSSNRIENIRFF